MNLLKNAKKKALIKNPREMIIFSYPKTGKTEAFTKIPNSLIIDFEGGVDFYDSTSVHVPNLEVLGALHKELIETKTVFDVIVLDTITSMYEGVVSEFAMLKYNKNTMRAKDFKPLTSPRDVDTLAFGLGHMLKRAALSEIKEIFKPYCKCLILAGHVNDAGLGTKEFDISSTIAELDVPGKLKNILALKTDAIGLLKRTKSTENTLFFITGVGNIVGTRVKHLAGKSFLLSKKLPDGTLETHWDKIFIK